MTKPNKLRFLVSATAIILLIVAFSILGQSVDFAELITLERLATTLDSAGPFAPLLLIVIMAGAVVISPIPSLPLDLAAGATFGPLLGAIYAVIGAEIGAILSFLIGRALGREVISRLLRVDVIFCEKCSDHKLMTLVFLARLVPIFSFDIISYGAGLTNMSLMTFAVATLLGMIPPTLALTYFGSSVVSAQLPLMLLAAVMVALFLFLPKLLMKYRSSWWAQLFMVRALLRVDVIFCEKCSDHKLMTLVFLARLVPIFSFDIISYGAGLTNMSLMTFAVATLLGMIPPTLALTYFGSSMLSAQLPLMLLATVVVALFLFLPKLLMKYRSSWWAQLFMGPPPGEAAPSRSVAAVTPLTGESAQRCPACGGPMA